MAYLYSFNVMNIIKAIEIRYFRSIHRLSLPILGDLTVFSGANDVGKSNILKTLNLFFNEKIDRLTELDFTRDFSLRRLDEVRRTSIKGKQFIRIDITFNRPENYKNSLPKTFTVTKTWFREQSIISDNLETLERQGKLPTTLPIAGRMLTQFINRIRFEYIPAIRDKAYFEYVLESLQDSLLSKQMAEKDPLYKAVTNLNSRLSNRAQSLKQDFKDTTNIEADISLPLDPKSLFRAFSVSTKWKDIDRKQRSSEPTFLSLALRGDGIQAVYIPSLLKFIAENSSYFHIWGFEEPENSVEYNLAIELANNFENLHSQNAQIFVTSHSPAFMTLKGGQTVSYRIYKDDDVTMGTKLFPSQIDPARELLSEDIGLFRIQEEIYQEFLKRKQDWLRTNEELDHLRDEFKIANKPIVFVEGKTDQTILAKAWEKLFPDQEIPYLIKCCDPVPEGEGGGSGGCDTLMKLLSTVLPDNPQAVIGVFDRDKEGIEAFDKLPGYFRTSSGVGDIKVSKNLKAAAIKLPIPLGREQHAEIQNLPIEYYFSDEVLARKTGNGKGLSFKPGKLVQREAFSGVQVAVTDSNEPHMMRIDGGKTVFAEEIVTTLATEDFSNFIQLFSEIKSAFASLNVAV